MSIDKEIVEDFVTESKNLIHIALDLLESIEGDFSQVKRLADYGNNVDRIMGGAKSLALLAGPQHALNIVADYAELCKAVSYKASQITDNPQFYDVCVGLLLDATESLDGMLDRMSETSEQIKKNFSQAIIDRLRWVSSQFSESYRATVDSTGSAKMDQSEIDALMKKLGL